MHAAVALAQRDRVDAAVPIDLRGANDLMRHRARLVIGRVGVVATGMRDRRLAIQAFDQRQDHRARRDIEMAATQRRDDHVRRVRRLGEPVGDVGQRRYGARTGEALIVEFGRNACSNDLVDGRGSFAVRDRGHCKHGFSANFCSVLRCQPRHAAGRHAKTVRQRRLFRLRTPPTTPGSPSHRMAGTRPDRRRPAPARWP